MENGVNPKTNLSAFCGWSCRRGQNIAVKTYLRTDTIQTNCGLEHFRPVIGLIFVIFVIIHFVYWKPFPISLILSHLQLICLVLNWYRIKKFIEFQQQLLLVCLIIHIFHFKKSNTNQQSWNEDMLLPPVEFHR
jgi:hypothetical protein